MGRIGKIKSDWNKFWFEPVPALRIGILRFLFFGSAYLFMRNRWSAEWGNVPEAFWQPVSFFIHFPKPSSALLAHVIQIWSVCTLFSAVGFLTFLSALGAAVTTLILCGTSICFGYFTPADANFVIFSFILALSPSGQGFSVDSLLARRLNWFPLKRVGAQPAWPLRLAWLFWSMMFFSAGLDKIKLGGWAWIASDNLRMYILHNQYWFDYRNISTVSPLALAVVRRPMLCRILAFLAIAFELMAPGALFSRRLRPWIVVSLLTFQISAALIMLVDFNVSFLCYLFFVPWDRIFEFTASHIQRSMSSLTSP